MKQIKTELLPVDKALNFVKSILEKNINFYGTTDFSMLSGTDSDKYISKKTNIFSLTVCKKDDKIHFIINDELGFCNDFDDKPEYSFTILDDFTKEDEEIFAKITDKIITLVDGLNKNVVKQISVVQKKYLIEHDNMKFDDCFQNND